MTWIALTFIVLCLLAIAIEPARTFLAALAEWVLYVIDVIDSALRWFWRFLWPEVWPNTAHEPTSCHLHCQCEWCVARERLLREPNDVY